MNTARGGLIESLDVAEALDNGTLSSVALDVLDNEPHLPTDLLERENVILTPHSAFYSKKSFIEVGSKSATTVKNFLMGQYLRDGITLHEYN